VDGRFREQRSRLFEWKNEHSHVIYVLEGHAKDVDKNQETCHRSLHRLSLVYGFCVWKTVTIQETADYVVWLSRQETLFQESNPIQDQITNLSQSMVKKKKDVKTSRNYLVAFLQSLSGISYDMADQIADQHQDMNDFIEMLKKENAEHFAKKTYKTKNGKDRKIGKEKSKIIYEILGIGLETS
jgi:ERCC4-type nuclease